jgi:hypothetical protein
MPMTAPASGITAIAIRAIWDGRRPAIRIPIKAGTAMQATKSANNRLPLSFPVSRRDALHGRVIASSARSAATMTADQNVIGKLLMSSRMDN